MRRVEFDNLSLACEDEGKGIPIVCIHGYPLNRQIWQPQWEGLASSVRVIAPDLRNHGDSLIRGNSVSGGVIHSMDLLADDLAHMLDAMSLSQPVVINGLSMGGYVAFALIRNYPRKVRGLILTATRARPDSVEEKANRLKAIQLAQTQGVAPIVDGMLGRLVSPKTTSGKPGLAQSIREIMLSNTVEGVIGDLRGMMDRPDARPPLPEIRVPVLILVGKDDQIIPIEEAQAMNDLIPDSRLEIIEDAGHLLNMEQPALYNRIVRSFIQSLERGQA
jgi:pimeloyl-ACP methyl ester carboxylesterase